jgi:hypothetical protein
VSFEAAEGTILRLMQVAARQSRAYSEVKSKMNLSPAARLGRAALERRRSSNLPMTPRWHAREARLPGLLARNAEHFGRSTRAASLVRMTEVSVPLEQQLEEIGAQLDWARGYL